MTDSTPTADTARQPSLAERLGRVRAGLRPELEFSRHVFHGEPAYVVRDPLTFQSHRFTPADYDVLVALSPDLELRRVFERLCARGLLTKDREEEFYQFVVHLGHLGLLTLPITQGKALYERYQRRKAAKRRFHPLALLFFRVPLVQPDAFLGRTVRFAAPLFTRAAFVVWLLAAFTSIGVVIAKWEEFRSPLGSMLATNNLPLLWFLLVLLKIVHEFGHAYACKHFGGSVPEMGAYFIMFTPCAYVDASASWGFPSRLHRIIVGLGGMYFESIAAMIALLVWVMTGPGLIHSAAQFAIVLSTVITVGFNANPLMQYDGYYILSDALGMPQLRRDARRQWLSLLKHGLFGVPADGVAKTRLGGWLLGLFGLATQLYRLTVLSGICVLIALKIPALGIGLALWYLGQTIVGGVRKLVAYVGFSPETAPVRRRAVLVSSALGLIAVCLLTQVPVRTALVADGVVRRAQEQVVYAEVPGFVRQTPVRAGDRVATDELLVELENPDLIQQAAVTRAQLDRWQLAVLTQIPDSVTRAVASRQKWEQVRFERRRLEDQLAALRVTAPIGGVVVDDQGLRLAGRYVQTGTPLATIADGPWVVHALLSDELMAAARPRLGQSVSVHVPGTKPCRGVVVRIAAAGTRQITESALTHRAGGSIAVGAERRAARPYFRLVIRLETADDPRWEFGQRACVKLGRERRTLGNLIAVRFLNLFHHVRMVGW